LDAAAEAPLAAEAALAAAAEADLAALAALEAEADLAAEAALEAALEACLAAEAALEAAAEAEAAALLRALMERALIERCERRRWVLAILYIYLIEKKLLLEGFLNYLNNRILFNLPKLDWWKANTFYRLFEYYNLP
jgi:hypothetical protein